MVLLLLVACLGLDHVRDGGSLLEQLASGGGHELFVWSWVLLPFVGG